MSLIDQAYYVTKLKINNSLKLLTKSMDENPANFDLEYKNLNIVFRFDQILETINEYLKLLPKDYKIDHNFDEYKNKNFDQNIVKLLKKQLKDDFDEKFKAFLYFNDEIKIYSSNFEK